MGFAFDTPAYGLAGAVAFLIMGFGRRTGRDKKDTMIAMKDEF